MFYCTIYQKTSGTDRVRLCLSFSKEQEALDAEAEIIKAAKNLGARIAEASLRGFYGTKKVEMIGHIACPGPNSSEIFIIDNNRTDKVFYTMLETEKTLGKERRLYHPINNLIVDGNKFLSQCKKSSSTDWYDELSELNN
jgi:hypothetical protein